jgi:O-acetyl-ADP-ribose deacetylase (regulator of RNase III)
MPVKFVSKNLFYSESQTVVNTVNCVGVMGKGIALEFKNLYPDMFRIYQKYCGLGLIQIGKFYIYRTDHIWILNFPTKIHWRNPSKIEYIEKGLITFVNTYKEEKINSITFPLLGTNNGGLDKEIVKNLMFQYLSKCDINIEICDFKKL